MTKTSPCPNCQEPSLLSKENTNRPFCSARCRNEDFIGWSNEAHTIAGNSEFDDLMSEDLENPLN